MKGESLMYQRILKWWNCDIGASAVEFALVSPLLILMMIGVVDMGVFAMERMRIQNTAYAAASYVAQVGDDTNVQVIADEAYEGDFNNIVLSSEFECECADGVAQACPSACGDGDYQRRFVNITASGTFDSFFPYPGLPDSVALERSVRMRVD